MKPSWRQTIDGHAVLPPIVGQAHRQLPYAAPAGSIGSQPGVARHTGDGADIDDAPVAPGNHATRDCLGDKEASTQIRIQNQIPVFPGDLKRGFADVAAGIVHEDIDMSESSFSSCGHHFNALALADIEFQGNGAPTEGRDLRLERQQAIAVAARDQKIRSRFGKGARHMLAEPPARTSDDGDSAAEIKQTVSHETSPGRRTTFITLGSRACKRSNQRGPSSSGAIAVMRFFT